MYVSSNSDFIMKNGASESDPAASFCDHSLRRRLQLLLLAIILLVSLFAAVVLVLYERRNLELLHNTLYETVVVFSRSVERELREVERLSTGIMSDAVVQRLLVELEASEGGFPYQQLADDLVRRLLFLSGPNYVESIAVVDTRNRVTNSRSDFPHLYTLFPTDSVQRFRNTTAAREWLVSTEDERRMYLLRRVREVEGLSLRYIGTVVLIVDKDRLARATVQTPFHGDFQFAVASGDNLVYSTDAIVRSVFESESDMVGVSSYQVISAGDEQFFASSVYVPNRDLTYLYLIPYHLLFSGIQRFNASVIMFSIALLTLVLLFSRWIVRDVSTPIIDLAHRMRTLEEADFRNGHVSLESYHRSDEIGVLYREFEIMLRRVDSLVADSYRSEIALKDSQFRSLQAQINPHFLYNTLESINWFAQLAGDDVISDMVIALGTLLRESIDTRKTAVTIRDELGLLQQYLFIQSTRYAERLQVSFDVEPGCLDFAIPKLTLQPLVENSVRYSLDTSPDTCHVRIHGTTSSGTVFLYVEDDGPGMRPEYARAILSGHVKGKGSSVGIGNIQDRLRALFGSSAAIQIHTQPCMGTMVELSFPAVSEATLASMISEVSVHAATGYDS